jgi:ribosomal protein S18 acetylase RimI-like enzyme
MNDQLVRLAVRRCDLDTIVVPCPRIHLAVIDCYRASPALRQDLLLLLREAFNDRPWTPDTVLADVLTPGECIKTLTARTESTSELVGAATVHTTARAGTFKLHWVAVASGWRRRGIGRLLAQQACLEAIEAGASCVELYTERYRTGAVALYESLGFRADGSEGAVG